MKAQFTPGPWKVFEGNYSPEGPINTVNVDVKTRICSVTNQGKSGDFGAAKANAYLIAAAPEMWNFLYHIAQDEAFREFDPELMEQIDECIKKIEEGGK